MPNTIKCCLFVFVIISIASSAIAQSIHEAVLSGDIDQVRNLIDANDSLVNMANDKGMTPLRLAVYTGNAEMVKVLLDHGANTDHVHPMYGSIINQAFTSACQKGSGPELVQILLDRGVAFDAAQTDALGMTPLDWAVHFGNSPMARLAVEHHADVNLTSSRMGRTPLVGAVSKGHGEIVNLLLRNGADVTIVDKNGYPPIYYAVDQGRAAILKALLDHGATTDYIEPHFGRSLLHLVAIKGYLDIAQDLITYGADINSPDNSGGKPLAYAIDYGNQAVADYLIAQGAPLPKDYDDHHGRSPVSSQKIASGDASIWYLNHRGWALETKNHFLVFDAEEFGVRRSDNPGLTNGFLTASDLDNHPVAGIFSCYHGLPGEPAYIHTLADSVKDIAFIHLIDDQWRGSPNTTYLKSREDTAAAGIKIRTIDIAEYMPMLAYLCTVDGLTIYYQAFGTDDPGKLQKSYDFLGSFADTVDIAFLPLPDSGQAHPDLRLFLDRFPTRSVVLLDPNRREYLFPEAAGMISEWGFKSKVFCAENPGDHFDYSTAKR